MLQREVAARLAAQPGDADYGRLGVMLAPQVRVERLFDVGPGAFQPAPRVWSAVVRLSMRAQPLFAVSPHYPAVVAAAFMQRRKTLRNALSQLLTREQIEACCGRSRCPRGGADAAGIQHPGTGPRPRASVTLVFPAAVAWGTRHDSFTVASCWSLT